MSHLDCSVVVSTYNRCERVIRTLQDLLSQQTGILLTETVVVDNGSTDGTREMLTKLAQTAPSLHYVYEPARGPASGRNAGIAHSRGRIIAFTDDDNRVAPDWVAHLVRALDENPDVDAVAGRIVPSWRAPTPAWLTPEHWVGPLAVQDYGETRFIIDASRPIALCTANFAVRRSVLDRIGGFASHLRRAEDTELLVRLWQAGGRCMYVPEALVAADVQPERMTRQYHRQWHRANGAWTAEFDLAELIARDGSLLRKRMDTLRVAGIPAFVLRELGSMAGFLAAAKVRRAQSQAVRYDHRLRFLVGYIGSRYRQHRLAHGHVRPREIYRFMTALLAKKLHSFFSTSPP